MDCGRRAIVAAALGIAGLVQRAAKQAIPARAASSLATAVAACEVASHWQGEASVEVGSVEIAAISSLSAAAVATGCALLWLGFHTGPHLCRCLTAAVNSTLAVLLGTCAGRATAASLAVSAACAGGVTASLQPTHLLLFPRRVQPLEVDGQAGVEPQVLGRAVDPQEVDDSHERRHSDEAEEAGAASPTSARLGLAQLLAVLNRATSSVSESDVQLAFVRSRGEDGRASIADFLRALYRTSAAASAAALREEEPWASLRARAAARSSSRVLTFPTRPLRGAADTEVAAPPEEEAQPQPPDSPALTTGAPAQLPAEWRSQASEGSAPYGTEPSTGSPSLYSVGPDEGSLRSTSAGGASGDAAGELEELEAAAADDEWSYERTTFACCSSLRVQLRARRNPLDDDRGSRWRQLPRCLAVVAPAAALGALGATLCTVKECWGYLVGVGVALPVLVLTGTLGPLLNGKSLASAVQEGAKKSWTFVLEVGAPVLVYYVDIGTGAAAIGRFWTSKKFWYFGLNVAAFVLCCLYAGRTIASAVTHRRTKACLACCAALQIFPALVLLLSLPFLSLCSNVSDFRLALKSPLGSGAPGVLSMLVYATLAEALVDAVTLLVQGYAFVHETWDSPADKAHLRLSVAISVLWFTKSLAEADVRGKALRVRGGRPWLMGTAEAGSLAFAAVAVFRCVSVCGRLLFLMFFRELNRERIVVGGFECEIPLMFVCDFAIQCWLTWRATGSLGKMAWALANLFSFVEPVLHGGNPVFSTYPTWSAGAHFLEAMIAGAVTLSLNGGLAGTMAILEDSTERRLLVLGVVCCWLQLPLLLTIRLAFAYDVHAEVTWDSFREAIEFGTSGMDKADARVPCYFILDLEQASFESSSIGDFGADVLATALEHNDTLWWLTLHQNQIGDLGAIALSTALVFNDTLQIVLLSDNQIGDEGARSLAEALRSNRSVTHICLDGNPIGEEGWSALRRARAAREEVGCGLTIMGLP